MQGDLRWILFGAGSRLTVTPLGDWMVWLKVRFRAGTRARVRARTRARARARAKDRTKDRARTRTRARAKSRVLVQGLGGRV